MIGKRHSVDRLGEKFKHSYPLKQGFSFTFLHIVLQANEGIYGEIIDKFGAPLSDGRVEVEGYLKTTHTSKTGDFWRILKPGDYKVTALAKNHFSMYTVWNSFRYNN